MDKRCNSKKTCRQFFAKMYPKMFGDSSGTEMDVDIDTTMETESRPIIDREEKLRKSKQSKLKKSF